MNLGKTGILLFSLSPDFEKKIIKYFQRTDLQLQVVTTETACHNALEKGSFDLFITLLSNPAENIISSLNTIKQYSPTMLTCYIGPLAQAKDIDMDFLVDIQTLSHEACLSQYIKNMIKLAQKNRIQAELSMILLHDLRSPAQSIIGYLELLENQVFGEMNEGQLQMISNATTLSDRLISILEELSEVHLFERKEFLLNKSKINLKTYTDQALRSLWVQADKKEIKFTPQIPSSLPDIVADGPRIERVLNNLITNAVNYTPEKGAIRITAEVSETPSQKPSTIFRIIDSGPGIPKSEIDFIFDKYYRAHSKQNDQKGFGLGLYICRLIIEAHGGSVGATNNPEGGSTFYFSLPM